MFEGTRKTIKRSFEALRILRLLRVSMVVLPLTGCASVQAKSKPADRPALNVPAPPARIIEPTPEPQPEPVTELPPATPANRSTRPPASRPETTAARPAETPPPVEPSPPVAPPAAPPRTPPLVDTSGAAKTVRTTIDTARSLLNGVNFAPLSTERKKAYNDAKLLIQQAEDALKEGNLAFAQGVASKAETLARELAGR